METALFRRTLPPRSAWEAARYYWFALGACALALGFTIPLYPYLQHAPRVFLFCAALASGRFGGLGPGVLAVALTTAMSRWLLPGEENAAENWVSLGTYLLVSLSAVAVVAQLRYRTLVLRDKERQLTDFMENATIGLQWLAEDGTVLWANKATCRMLDCSSAKCCMGRKFQEYCVNPLDGQAVLRRLASDERLKNYEITLRARDGSPRVVLLDANVLWKAGRFVHARCFLRDISARKQAELAAQENVAKFRAVFDQSIDAIVVFKDGKLLMANPACLKLFGFDLMEALASRDVLEMIAVSHRPQVQEYFERRSRGDAAPFHYQTRGRRQDGAEFEMEVTASPFALHGQPHTLAILRDVTERVRAEETLAQERNLLRTVIDALPDCVYTKDPESRFLISNQANVRLLGGSSETDVRGKSVLDLCPAEYAQPFVEDDRQVVRSGQPLVNREEAFLRSDGEVRTLLTTKLPLRHTTGEVTALVGISRDITENKRADEALRKSEASLKLAQRIGCIGSWEADLEKDTLVWSEETYRIFGRTPETFTPSKAGFFDQVHPEDRATVRRVADHALLQGRYYSVDYRIVRADGSERYLVQQARILHNTAGQPAQMIGTVQDITERKRVEMALRESEERFRALFERSPESIFILDPLDGARLLPIVDCNEGACRQHGYNREELVGQPFGLLDAAARSPEQVEAFIERVRRERLMRFETSHCRKNGDPCHLERWVSLITVGDRELLLDMGRDISERKIAEESIRQWNEELEARVQERTRQLEQANRELEAFSYSVSHDLRAPVRAISGFAQIIHEDHGERLDGEVARLFQIISNSARRMGELIDDLLAFSRLNVQETDRASVDMTALAQSVIAELLRERPDSKVGIRLAQLPAVVGDESMLRQVFANLLSNAVKFSDVSAAPAVEIGARSETGQNIFFVRDNGVGFDMKYAAKLFKVFQRLHNAEQFEGTGVGLAIVRRIVQRHGGEVWAESKPGEGATFCFSLPTTPGTRAGERTKEMSGILIAECETVEHGDQSSVSNHHSSCAR